MESMSNKYIYFCFAQIDAYRLTVAVAVCVCVCVICELLFIIQCWENRHRIVFAFASWLIMTFNRSQFLSTTGTDYFCVHPIWLHCPKWSKADKSFSAATKIQSEKWRCSCQGGGKEVTLHIARISLSNLSRWKGQVAAANFAVASRLRRNTMPSLSLVFKSIAVYIRNVHTSNLSLEMNTWMHWVCDRSCEYMPTRLELTLEPFWQVYTKPFTFSLVGDTTPLRLK